MQVLRESLGRISMGSRLVRFGSVLLCGLLGACAAQFVLPMSAETLVQHGSGEALVAYLSQSGKGADVCDQSSRGPHLRTLHPKGYAAFVDGLTGGRIEPGVWLRCAQAFCRSGTCPTDSAQLLGIVSRSYRKLLTDSDFEKSPALQERLRALHDLYTERAPDLDSTPLVQDQTFLDLRAAISEHRLGKVAAQFGSDLLTAFDLETGKYFGRAVDLPMIDALFRANDEKVLRRFAARLSPSELRDEARRRVIRLGIASSPFPELKERADLIERIVMQHGAYVLSLAEHPPVRAFLNEQTKRMQGLLLRQSVARKKASLLAYNHQPPYLEYHSEITLQQWLLVEVEGVSRPVTLCDPARQLDPTPCISPDVVNGESALVSIDKRGVLRFADELPISAVLSSLRNRLTLPIRILGKPLFTFDWPFVVERPQDLILSGSEPGDSGPSLKVLVDLQYPAYSLFTVSTASAVYAVVVENRDVAAFHIVSRGTPGIAGSDGARGWDGNHGGECQNGSNGSSGGPGGAGGLGGNGGEILVEVKCGQAPCEQAVAMLPRTILSTPGPGGPGGRGGVGGRGGWGGPARLASTHTDSDGNTVTDDPGCSAGMSGSSGANGFDGENGAPGRPGQVRFTPSSPGR